MDLIYMIKNIDLFDEFYVSLGIEMKKKIGTFYANIIEDCKKELPEIVHECLKDYCFLMFCQTKGNPKIDRTNFLFRIRDYFILDLNKADFEDVRNEKTYEEIKINMKNTAI